MLTQYINDYSSREKWNLWISVVKFGDISGARIAFTNSLPLRSSKFETFLYAGLEKSFVSMINNIYIA